MELYLEPERPKRNLLNGQFFKGNVPHNKGKKWDEWMSKKGQKKVKRIIHKHLPHKGNPNLAGWNARPIFALDDEGNTVGWFKSSNDAERKVGICSRNIRSVLEGKRKHAGGYRWIYDTRKK